MRNLKKVLALVLAMAMSLSLAVTAGAAFNDQDKIVNTEAVDMCVALNIINGRTDGSFDPAGDVTRAEMAKMICIVLNGGKAPTTSTKATPTFADIDGHWAEGFIEYCYAKGVIAGKSATQFDPNGKVTGTEAAKMLLVALGYNADVEKMVGANWALYTNVLANQDGLYEGLEAMDPGAALSRDNAAQMIWNALQAMTIKVTSSIDRNDGSIVDSYNKTTTDLLAAKYGTLDTDETTGILTGASYNTTKGEYTYTVADVDYTFKTSADYTELLGHNVCFVAKAADKVLGAYAEDSAVVVSGVIGDIDMTTYTGAVVEIADVEYDLGDVDAFAFAAGSNSISAASALIADVDAFKALAPYYEFVAIDNNDDDKIDVVIVYVIEIATVGYVGSEYVKMTGSATEYDEDYTVYEGIAKKDDVTIVADTSLKTKGIVAELETQTGTVESYDSEAAVIDGTSYDYTGITASKITDNLDKTVEFRAVNGYIVYADGTTTADVSDYAVVTKIAGEAGMTGPQAKLLYTDGTEAVVDLAADYANGVEDNEDTVADETVAAIPVGTLVTFEEDDGEYTLTAVTSLAGYEADEQTNVAGAWNESEKGKANASITIDGVAAKFADDAIVFVFDGEDYMVKTGADLAKVTDADASVVIAGAAKNSTNALTVNFAYVNTAGTVETDTQYGYVISGLSTKTIDGDAYYTVKVWNGEEVTLTFEKTSSFNTALVAKGEVISYTIDADGYAEDIADVEYSVGAISVIDGDTVYVGSNKLVIDEDTVEFFIDSKEVKGDEAGELAIAYDAEDSEGYVPNVWFVEGEEDALVLVIGDCINETGIYVAPAAE